MAGPLDAHSAPSSAVEGGDAAAKRAAIRFLGECYREDRARSGLWDVFADSVPERMVLAGRESLADGLLDHAPLPLGEPGEAERFEREALLRAGEFELLYGLPFVCGRAQPPGAPKPRRLCAPLFLFRARISSGRGFAAVEIDGGRRLNLPLLELLLPDGDAAQLAEELGGTEVGEPLGEREMLQVESTLRGRCPDLSLEGMRAYPELIADGDLRAAARSRAEGLRLVGAAALALWPKSEAARGVVTELGELAAAGSFSKPLRVLMGGDLEAWPPPTCEGDARPPMVPALLSGAQQKIVLSARRHALTFVNGPPGTGKSFTIAAVALDHLARGESVLIAAQNADALEVIADKIEETHGVSGCVVRAGRKQYLREVKAQLESMLAGEVGKYPFGRRPKKVSTRQLERLHRAFQARAARELGWGGALREGGWLAALRRWWIARRVRATMPLWELSDITEEVVEGQSEAIRAMLAGRRAQDLDKVLRFSRDHLMRFDRALRSRRGARKEALFADTDFAAVAKALPVWLVPLGDLERVLPHRPEMFDVAIIDEATQCDMAGALPALQRAKRAVVAGDPKQLRHISFLSRSRQTQLAEQCGVDPDDELADYRDHSLLDLVFARIGSQAQVGFLDEHFRCAPEIIAFSNARFYGGRLRVMTERPLPVGGGAPALRFVEVGGRRDEAGVNRAEIDRCVELLRAILREDAALPAPRTVGVLSPFRAQVEALREALAAAFDAGQFGRLSGAHRLRVGTAHSFQGDERDLMVLSFGIDSHSHPSALRFLERPDVFNVAVTRARREQVALLSFDPGALPAGSLLRAYTGSSSPAPGVDGGERPSSAEEELVGLLRSWGCAVGTRRLIAGEVFDLVAGHGGRVVAIDLIGFPGRAGEPLPLERHQMFRRAGTRVFPLAFTSWEFDRERLEGALRRVLAPR